MRRFIYFVFGSNNGNFFFVVSLEEERKCEKTDNITFFRLVRREEIEARERIEEGTTCTL